MDEFYRALCRAAGEEQVKRQESMALHTTFRTGGPAAFFASVKTEEELRETVGACREYQVPYYMLGNGSNLLVGSAGFPGVMIRLDGELKEWGILREEEDGRVLLKAGAGLLLSKIGRAALEEGLTGFEFAAGGGGDHRLVRTQSRVNHRFICLSSAYQKVDGQIGTDAVGTAALFYNQFSRLLTVGVQTVAWILSQIGVYHGLQNSGMGPFAVVVGKFVKIHICLLELRGRTPPSERAGCAACRKYFVCFYFGGREGGCQGRKRRVLLF